MINAIEVEGSVRVVDVAPLWAGVVEREVAAAVLRRSVLVVGRWGTGSGGAAAGGAAAAAGSGANTNAAGIQR